MNITAEEPKKDPPKEKEFAKLVKGWTFDEKVTVQWYVPGGEKPVQTKEAVGAKRFMGEKEKGFWLVNKDLGPVVIRKGSRIVDSDGNVYETLEIGKTTTDDTLVKVKRLP